jgi:ferredoxin-NADP reductase
MTAPQLLIYIVAALLLQLGIGIVYATSRRRGEALAPAAAAEPAPPPLTLAWPGWRPFRVARREFEDAKQAQCSFHLEPVDGAPLPPFSPGQFLTFRLQVADAGAQGGERPITRCYSLSDRPEPGAYRITVKRIPAPADRPDLPPGASSSHFHDRVHEGDVVDVKAPSGHFFIDPDASVPAVLIGGGIGITPMMSMLRWCLAEQPGRALHLYYGLACGEEQAFKAVLEDLAAAHPNFRLHVVYSRPGPNDVLGRDHHHQGHVDVDLLRRTLPHGRHRFYVCGPPPMMQSLVPAIAAWGVAEDDIHFEAFGPATVRLARAEAPAADAALAGEVEVRFARSGRTLVWDGQDENLLDFAERHALVVDSGCRSGGCGSCETRLVSGSVRYANAPDHDVAPGHCLLCVGKPASALVLEA